MMAPLDVDPMTHWRARDVVFFADLREPNIRKSEFFRKRARGCVPDASVGVQEFRLPSVCFIRRCSGSPPGDFLIDNRERLKNFRRKLFQTKMHRVPSTFPTLGEKAPQKCLVLSEFAIGLLSSEVL